MSTTEDHKEDSQVYELGYLVLPSIPEESLPQVVDSIKKAINEAGGKELDGESPFKLDLAYPMSKIVGSSKYVANDAYFGWLKFELPINSEEDGEHPVDAIKKGVEEMNEILRFLLTKAPRETYFTFAKAREALVKEEEPEIEEEDDNDVDTDEEVVE